MVEIKPMLVCMFSSRAYLFLFVEFVLLSSKGEVMSLMKVVSELFCFYRMLLYLWRFNAPKFPRVTISLSIRLQARKCSLTLTLKSFA